LSIPLDIIKKVAKILLKLPVLTFTGIYLDKSQGECSFCYNDLSDMKGVHHEKESKEKSEKEPSPFL